jgi:hypothetical protein
MILVLLLPVLAQAERTAVVIESGQTDLFVESLVRATLEAELGHAGLEVASEAAVGGEVPKVLAACEDTECLRLAVKPLAVGLIIFVSLKGEERDSGLHLELRGKAIAEDGSERAAAKADCDDCQSEERMKAFGKAFIEELLKTPAPPQVVAVKEAAQDLAPPKPVAVAPAPPPAEVSPASPQRDYLPAIALGVGIAGLFSGAALVIMDGPQIKDGLRQPEERATATGGWLTMGAGAALVGVSAWLWLRVDERRAVSATPTQGGAVVRWGGRF